MKRISDVFSRIASLENLSEAERDARRGKEGKAEVVAFSKDRERLMEKLHDALLDGTFRTSPYRNFTIDNRGKLRVISRLPFYPDSIVHHAIVRVLGPVWRRSLPPNVHSCVIGKGIHSALGQTRRIITRYKDAQRLYCLKTDISKFYPSIQHGTLKAAVRRKVKDKDVLSLLDGIIESTDGLPIGNHTSPYLANLLLAPLLRKIWNETGGCAVGYADDFVIISPDKAYLHALRRDIIEPGLQELGLKIKPTWQVFPISDAPREKGGRPVDFIGYAIYRKCTLLRKSIKLRWQREARRLAKRKMPYEARRQRLASWQGWAMHADAIHLTKKTNFNPQRI